MFSGLLRSVVVVVLSVLSVSGGRAGEPDPRDWGAVVAQARGQEVYFHAWGGLEKINDYIQWVRARVREDYGIDLKHVKVTDTAHVVSQVLAEKTAGGGGAVDLVWINGENFAAMKANGLLFGPFAEDLPNFALVDVVNKPSTRVDFTIPVAGMEAPWGMAKLNFLYDTARTAQPPRTAAELLDWARRTPGRLTYPAPPDFMGTTFLKQLLSDLTVDPAVLQRPPTADNYGPVTGPLWDYLDALHPLLWRGGQDFAANAAAQLRMFNDSEIDVHMVFSPFAATAFIETGEAPETTRSFVFEGGTIGNSHFVAIPFNAAHKAAALVVANFLMSPEAQARKHNPQFWGDPTVLDVTRLDEAARAAFAAIDLGPATLRPADMGPTRLEPHPDWVGRLEQDWLAKYSQ